MSRFFSLEPGSRISKVHKNHQNQDEDEDRGYDDRVSSNPCSLYLFKNQEIYSKRDFELWHHQHQPPNYGSYNNIKEMRHGGSYNSGGMNCQDCGNQAKKDCEHMRCRTCCKSRGLHCQTHVKSTWVPAAKRRERQQQVTSLTQQHNSGNQQLSLMMRASTGSDQHHDHTQTPKRPREDHHHHQPNITITTVAGNRSGGGGIPSSGLEVGNFPAEVSAPAVFRCVRVSAMDEAEEQLAYQTAVSIGGHVFKGILYDKGPEGPYNQSGEGSSSGGAQLQRPNLITLGTTTETTGINPVVGFTDPSSTYPTPFGAFMAGTQFFPPPRS